MNKGYIYCFSNPSLSNILKIGMTERTPRDRLLEANSSTWTPTPFKLELAKKVNNPRLKESILHKLLQKYNKRINNKREFFEISIEELKLFFDLLDGEEYTINDSNTINDSKITRPECPFKCKTYRRNLDKMIGHLNGKCYRRPNNSICYKSNKTNPELLEIERNLVNILEKKYKKKINQSILFC